MTPGTARTGTSTGLVIAAPASGSGKTTLTLGLLRALARRGLPVRGAKSGPDYIDPRFHEAACGAPCPNLDAWAMGPERLRALAAGTGLLLVEGAMGLFDGAPPDGAGSTAALARALGLPVILMIDAARMGQSVAALVAGFVQHDPSLSVAGLVLNRVGSAGHEALLRRALAGLPPVLGAIPRAETLRHPSRHLGLVQAEERPDLEAFLDGAADLVAAHLDLDALLAVAAPLPTAPPAATAAPPAQRISIAADAAFAFTYPHRLADWRAAGAEIRPFSPLADEPVPEADLVLLPGGYPELHAPRLAAATTFMQSLRRSAETSSIYGECGGYILLGQGLVDAHGQRHAMAGLLPLETSFRAPRLTLGYRRVSARSGAFPGRHAAHEFHYAAILSERGTPLWTAEDAEGAPLPPMGLVERRISGSFAHLIEPLS